MNEAMEARVRTRAYELWENDASPDGRAEHYWETALRQLEAEGDADDRSPALAQDQSARQGRVESAAQAQEPREIDDASDTADSSYMTGKPGL